MAGELAGAARSVPALFCPFLADVVQPCCRRLLAVVAAAVRVFRPFTPLPFYPFSFWAGASRNFVPGGIEERFPVFGVHFGDDGLGEFPDLGVQGEVHLVGREVSGHGLCELPDGSRGYLLHLGVRDLRHLRDLRDSLFRSRECAHLPAGAGRSGESGESARWPGRVLLRGRSGPVGLAAHHRGGEALQW